MKRAGIARVVSYTRVRFTAADGWASAAWEPDELHAVHIPFAFLDWYRGYAAHVNVPRISNAGASPDALNKQALAVSQGLNAKRARYCSTP